MHNSKIPYESLQNNNSPLLSLQRWVLPFLGTLFVFYFIFSIQVEKTNWEKNESEINEINKINKIKKIHEINKTKEIIHINKISEINEINNINEIEEKSTTPASEPTEPPPKRAFVYTSGCHMPYVDPFSEDAMKAFKVVSYQNCSNEADIVTSEFDKSLRRYKLHINDIINSAADISCCYQEILRSGSGNNADDSFKALPCIIFEQDFLVPTHIGGVLVECRNLITDNIIQMNAFSFVQDTNTSVVTSPQPSPSVIILGIDSMSRVNFRRTMPQLYKYVTDKNFFELEGLNKMGDNTFPNLMAFLTGYNLTAAEEVCQPETVGGLDKCNFTWNYYKQQGYKTAYAEDWYWASSFNYLKKGFLKQPTDHYLRPLTIAIETLLPEPKQGVPPCYGQRHNAEYIYDYAMQFTEYYKNEPYFGFFWSNTFSHDYFSLPSSMDTRMLQYFQEMEANGVLDKAIVILLGDHGMRYGPIRDLPTGFLEERWPMFHISLPKWFQDAHSDFVAALKVNRNRLVSMYDLYITLNHILELNQGPTPTKYPQPQGCPKCQSVFYVVPENRTCNDSGISEHWCSCNAYIKISTSLEIIDKIAKWVVDALNNYLIENDWLNKCAIHSLKSINDASKKLSLKYEKNQLYRIKFDTYPKSASYEATVSFDPISNDFNVNVATISRLNSYENDSHCIDDKQAKKFCICVS